ncbi:MAG: hypothetical protein WDZ74_02610, partial [Candidatus Paceibacterota bacterium]
ARYSGHPPHTRTFTKKSTHKPNFTTSHSSPFRFTSIQSYSQKFLAARTLEVAMSALKMFRAAALLVYTLGALGFSQNDTLAVQGDVATFVLEENGTVWDIWEQYGSVSWTAFYNATAPLNPEEATDRFTSVPIGALISVPTSALRSNLVSSLPVVETVPTSEVSILSGQVEDLSGAILLQNSLVQNVSTSLETLASAVENLRESVPPVIASPARINGLTVEQWLLLGLILVGLLISAILVTAVVLRSREQKKLRATVRDLQHYPVVVPRTRDAERDKLEVSLHRENRGLRESNVALEAEKKGLEEQIRFSDGLLSENKRLSERNEILESIVKNLAGRLGLYEESPELPVGDGSQKTRRGTHGGGRPYNV